MVLVAPSNTILIEPSSKKFSACTFHSPSSEFLATCVGESRCLRMPIGRHLRHTAAPMPQPRRPKAGRNTMNTASRWPGSRLGTTKTVSSTAPLLAPLGSPLRCMSDRGTRGKNTLPKDGRTRAYGGLPCVSFSLSLSVPDRYITDRIGADGSSKKKKVVGTGAPAKLKYIKCQLGVAQQDNGIPQKP